MFLASFLLTWIAFFLTVAAPPSSQFLRITKTFLAFAFAWFVVESIRYAMLAGNA